MDLMGALARRVLFSYRGVLDHSSGHDEPDGPVRPYDVAFFLFEPHGREGVAISRTSFRGPRRIISNQDGS